MNLGWFYEENDEWGQTRCVTPLSRRVNIMTAAPNSKLAFATIDDHQSPYLLFVADKDSASHLPCIGHLAAILDFCIAVEHMTEAYASQARLHPTYAGRTCWF